MDQADLLELVRLQGEQIKVLSESIRNLIELAKINGQIIENAHKRIDLLQRAP